MHSSREFYERNKCRAIIVSELLDTNVSITVESLVKNADGMEKTTTSVTSCGNPTKAVVQETRCRFYVERTLFIGSIFIHENSIL